LKICNVITLYQEVKGGGLDNYNNLVLITKEVHKLIHSTKLETINKNLKYIPTNKDTIEKLNKFRTNIGNTEICL